MRDLMNGLAGRLRGLPGRDDRGAIATIVVILIGAGVLLGMGAMVVDVGQLYAERAQLQNGADAGSLAVAKSCATGSCTPAIATSYADANSADGASAVNLVCGSGVLGGCPASTGKITDCPAAPPLGTNYVDVHTSTLTSGGSTLLPPSFARTLLGNGSYQGSTVLACAQAQWGPPTAGSGLAVTFSACEWDQATNNGTLFAPPPPYPPNPLPSPTLDRVLKLHTTSSDTGCPSEPSGADGPGFFGWTSDPGGNCMTPVINGSYGDKPGVSVSQACKTVLSADQANRTLVFLPIYVSETGNGANGVYTLKGFAAFVITGYSLPGFSASDWLNPANNCKGSDKCINGYFTQGLMPTDGSIGGQYLGASIIKLTG
ncbi:MAG TPA: TadE/TadG family type IV pilus assembly protein [Streptosporangiaceae bacterium]|nr:TadE/TadG family type IV pilus assembly protein [Streptosporangiaceae bacterium]